MKTFSKYILIITCLLIFPTLPVNALEPFLQSEYNRILEVGNKHYEQKKYSMAKHFYEQALHIDQENPNAYINLAAVLIIEENYKEASQTLQTALKLNPNDDTTLYSIYYNLGSSYYKQKAYNASKEFFLKAESVSPNSIQLKRSLVLANKAIEESSIFNQEITTKPIQITNHPKFSSDTTPHLLEKPKESNPINLAQLLEAAKEAYNQKNYPLSENLLREYVKTNPQSLDGNYRLGTILALQEKNEEANDFFLTSLKINPKHPSSLIAIGNLSLQKAEYKEALNYYNRAKRIDTNNPYIYYNLGLCFVSMNNEAAALKNFKKAKKLAQKQNNTNLLTKINLIYKD